MRAKKCEKCVCRQVRTESERAAKIECSGRYRRGIHEGRWQQKSTQTSLPIKMECFFVSRSLTHSLGRRRKKLRTVASSGRAIHIFIFIYIRPLSNGDFVITKCQIWPGHHNEIFIDGALCFHISGDAACRIFALCALGLAYNLRRFAEKIEACHLYSVE